MRYLQRKRIPLMDNAEAGEDEFVENIADPFDLETAYANAETMSELHKAVEALPPVQRTVLTLYYLEELSTPEIAGITGIATGTIKSHLFRARVRLRSTLDTLAGAVT